MIKIREVYTKLNVQYSISFRQAIALGSHLKLLNGFIIHVVAEATQSCGQGAGLTKFEETNFGGTSNINNCSLHVVNINPKQGEWYKHVTSHGQTWISSWLIHIMILSKLYKVGDFHIVCLPNGINLQLPSTSHLLLISPWRFCLPLSHPPPEINKWTIIVSNFLASSIMACRSAQWWVSHWVLLLDWRLYSTCILNDWMIDP